jgi:hypothetical protein
MPPRGGLIRGGHPFVEIAVSSDGKTGTNYHALIDTGYSGFVSLPIVAASLLGLKAHTTSHYTLANGKQSEPIPHGHGFACVVGDPYVKGLIAFSQNVAAVVGVDFLTRCGHILMMSSTGVILLNEKEIEEALRKMAKDIQAHQVKNTA